MPPSPPWASRRKKSSNLTMVVATAAVYFLGAVFLQAVSVDGMIHNLSINKDSRRVFQIESFGFRERGYMNLTVSHFSVEGPEPYRAGFVVKRTSTESSAREELEDALADLERENRCLLDESGPGALVLEINDRPNTATTREQLLERTYTVSTRVQEGQKGLYVLLYCGCPGDAPVGDTPSATGRRALSASDGETRLQLRSSGRAMVAEGTGDGGGSGGVVQGAGKHVSSFKLRVAFWNEGVGGAPDYLSAGDEVLPTLFFCMFVLFLLALFVWVQCIRRNPTQVHHIHHMMAVLLVFKTLSMLFESIRYHYIRITGAAEAWSIIYYLFAFLKGITLFVVILLIGTGWSLIKPFLNARDKRIIFVVLSLQVLNNVAQIVLEETAPGSIGWLKWRSVLHVVDLVCCCSILFPIIWSIRHLRQASLADGKAENTIRRLNVFRHFYKMVLIYVYFTRIVLVLLSAMLPFELSWVQQLSSEMATLVFFVVTGWRFRPQPDAPYLPVGRDEDQGREYGTDDEHAALMELQSLRRESGRQEA